MSGSGQTTPRSRSRSKRSTTNLSNLRLAPLSSKYVDTSREIQSARITYGESSDNEFYRQHSSYIQGRSAPSTPGILSRSSSRRSNGAGLSRREVTYDETVGKDNEEMNFAYAGRRYSYDGERDDFAPLTKARSEAAISDSPYHLGQGTPGSRSRRLSVKDHPSHGHRRAISTVENNWLMRTGAATSAILQESKGQSWLASRESSTIVTRDLESEDDVIDDDEGYEEMAAISATTAKLHAAITGGSPEGRRPSQWGSRYGSRSASRRASRAVSPRGSRTPRRSDVTGYFDSIADQLPKEEPGFTHPRERTERYEDQQEVERLTSTQSFGLGAIVDGLMNFKLFKLEEQGEAVDEDMFFYKEAETDEEAKKRMAAEVLRKREEKASITQLSPVPTKGENGQAEAGGWQDAAWLLSVATKAIW